MSAAICVPKYLCLWELKLEITRAYKDKYLLDYTHKGHLKYEIYYIFFS